jgi:hypothetical protein
MAKRHRRISVGFQGGQVLSLRVTDEQLETLYSGLGDGGWHELQTEDGPVRVYLGQVVYVRTEDSDRGVGFGV